MARWEPDARGRLGEAARALYAERGYEATTVADIAERAGLTKRTFFRHFADKREVLFSGSRELEDAFVVAVRDAPQGTSPLDAVAGGLDAVATWFAGRRTFVAWRQQLVRETPELQERELIKMASMVAAVTAALRARGVADPQATLAAEAGIAVFRVGFARWVDDGAADSPGPLMRDTLDALRAVVADRGADAAAGGGRDASSGRAAP